MRSSSVLKTGFSSDKKGSSAQLTPRAPSNCSTEIMRGGKKAGVQPVITHNGQKASSSSLSKQHPDRTALYTQPLFSSIVNYPLLHARMHY